MATEITHDVRTTLAAEDGKLFEVAEQDFDAGYWAGLQWAREQDRLRRCPDLWRVASVPAVFVHKWLKEGFDIYREPLDAIVCKIKTEDLDDFLTTEKRIV